MMPEIVTLQEAKLFCRIDGNQDDTLLALLIGAASAAVMDVANGWSPTDPVPDRIKLAVLAQVARAYDNRADGIDTPEAAMRLLGPLRRLDV